MMSAVGTGGGLGKVGQYLKLREFGTDKGEEVKYFDLADIIYVWALSRCQLMSLPSE